MIRLAGLLLGLFLGAASPEDSQYPKVIVAYVTSWTQALPDTRYVTHINYAFGHVTETFDGVRIDNAGRLKTVTALKAGNKELKVLLSIGGWGSGRFSEMAADQQNRKKFAEDCARVVKEYNLDGIDIDWEYPTSKAGGISASDDDTQNFTLLMKDIRKAIGRKKLLTLASVMSGRYIDFSAIKNVVDFVNIMAYDSGNPPRHHAPLHRSDLTGSGSAEEGIKAHHAAGMPMNKLVLGIPFYGRGNNKDVKGFVHYRDLIQLTGFESRWDAVAKVPYLVNAAGDMVCTYESPESIKIKAAFINANNLRGAMYWEYAGDTDDGLLSRTVFEEVTETASQEQ